MMNLFSYGTESGIEGVNLNNVTSYEFDKKNKVLVIVSDTEFTKATPVLNKAQKQVATKNERVLMTQFITNKVDVLRFLQATNCTDVLISSVETAFAPPIGDIREPGTNA